MMVGRAGAMPERLAAVFGTATADDAPWAENKIDLAHSKVGIVTTAGLFVKGDKPFRDFGVSGDFTYRAIPKDTPLGSLSCGRFWMDPRLWALDPNVVFPAERLSELAAKGFIRAIASRHYSVANFLADVRPLVHGSAREIARRFRYDGVDKALVFAASPLGDEAAVLIQRAIEEEGVPTVSLVHSRAVVLALRAPRACILKKGALCRLREYLETSAQTELLITMLRQFESMKRGSTNVHEID